MSGAAKDPSASEALCILPWAHVEVMPEGGCKPCCVAGDVIRERGRPVNVGERGIESIRRSRSMRSLRRALASGEKAEVCSYCWNQEQRGEPSSRQEWNRSLGAAVKELSERSRGGTDPSEPLPLQYLQLSMGNRCNLACRMCNASYSSRIAEDPVHARFSPRMDWRLPLWRGGLPSLSGPPPARDGFVPGVPWFEQEEFFRAELLEGGANLRFLYVTGGEPFLNESFGRLIAEYTRRGWARNITLTINTNLFHNEARIHAIVESLLPFGQCKIGASVDGHGAVYEYIRYPGRWDIVERNLRIVRSVAAANPNLILFLAVVVQPYNCLDLVDLLRFADGLDVECYPHVIDGPYFMRMRVVPRDLRLRAAERLAAYAASAGGSPWEAANRGHASRVARHLEGIEDGGKAARDRRRFVEFTNALDESRGQRLASAVPDLAAALASP